MYVMYICHATTVVCSTSMDINHICFLLLVVGKMQRGVPCPQNRFRPNKMAADGARCRAQRAGRVARRLPRQPVAKPAEGDHQLHSLTVQKT